MKSIWSHGWSHGAFFPAFRKPLSDIELTKLWSHQTHQTHEIRESFSYKAESVVLLMNKALHFITSCQIIAYESSCNLLDLRSRYVTWCCVFAARFSSQSGLRHWNLNRDFMGPMGPNTKNVIANPCSVTLYFWSHGDQFHGTKSQPPQTPQLSITKTPNTCTNQTASSSGRNGIPLRAQPRSDAGASAVADRQLGGVQQSREAKTS